MRGESPAAGRPAPPPRAPGGGGGPPGRAPAPPPPTEGPAAAALGATGRPEMVAAQRMDEAPPDPEVPEKPIRRRFTGEYKRRVLEQADACSEPGQLGALLRREGLYSSHLTTWRKQRDEGTLAGPQPQKRGPKSKRSDPLVTENERLRRENKRLSKRLRQAETIIDIQKRASEILGICLDSPESDDDE